MLSDSIGDLFVVKMCTDLVDEIRMSRLITMYHIPIKVICIRCWVFIEHFVSQKVVL